MRLIVLPVHLKTKVFASDANTKVLITLMCSTFFNIHNGINRKN